VRGEARKKPGTTPPSAMRLAELMAVHLQLTNLVRGGAEQYERAADDADELSGMSFAIAMNALKVAASELVLDVVSRAMLICGMAGYRNDSALSLGRLLRDAYGAQVMINNDRINTNNAQLLLVARD
jgi:acyl-CoA dehydrogenase